MIFAAGNGTRLANWTNAHPKALVPVCGVPMLERVMLNIKNSGINRVLINTHHFASQIADFLEVNDYFGMDVKVSYELELLETGGGVANALSLFGIKGPLLIHNADILTDINLKVMVDKMYSTNVDGLLIAWMRKTKRYLYFDDYDRMVGWLNPSTGCVKGYAANMRDRSSLLIKAFGGIQVLNEKSQTKLLEYASGRRAFSIIDFYIDCCMELDLRSYTPSEPWRWHDVGTPEKLLAAEKDFAKQ